MEVVRHKSGLTLKEVIRQLKNDNKIEKYYTNQPETLPIFGYRENGTEIDEYFLTTDSEHFDPNNCFVAFFLTKEHYQIVKDKHDQIWSLD